MHKRGVVSGDEEASRYLGDHDVKRRARGSEAFVCISHKLSH